MTPALPEGLGRFGVPVCSDGRSLSPAGALSASVDSRNFRRSDCITFQAPDSLSILPYLAR